MAAASAAQELLHDILGPLRPILAREDVTDLCINGPGLLFVEGAHGWERIRAENPRPSANQSALSPGQNRFRGHLPRSG